MQGYPGYPNALRSYGARSFQGYGTSPALPACVRATIAGPWNLAPGDDLTFTDDGGFTIHTATFLATPAEQNAGAAEPYNVDARTVVVRVGPASEPTQTVNLVGVAATAADVAAQFNAQLVGISASDNAGTFNSRTDEEGTAARYEIVGGSALGALSMVANVDTGGGNVADINAVTEAEAVSIFAAAGAPGSTARANGGLPEICSTATGPSAREQVTGGSAEPAFGFGNSELAGTGATIGTLIRWGYSRGVLLAPPRPPAIES